MANDSVGRIERVPFRRVWPHEARDFTVWLRDNIEVLNDVTRLQLTSAEAEQPAGSFSVDLVAEDETGRPVIVENQLEKSDHDHLGKVITYLTSFDASAAVWIVREARPEHVQAVAWLNESTAADFFLIKVEAITIEGSQPAPLMTLIVGPSEEAKEIGRRKGELKERHVLRRKFWTGLLEEARDRTPMFSRNSPRNETWLSTHNIPFTGINLSYHILMAESGGYIYIDAGPGSEERNRAIYETLLTDRQSIESAYGAALTWTPPDGRRSAVVSFTLNGGGLDDRDAWPEIQNQTVEAMESFWSALEPALQRATEEYP